MIDSPATAAEALRDYFLANAEAGDNAANDKLVAELMRRIRARQTSGCLPDSMASSGGPGG